MICEMGRDHSRTITSRRNQRTKKIKRIILFCEGRSTEPTYFELLKKNNCKVFPVVVPGNGIGSCVEFVKLADKKFKGLPRTSRNKYCQKWLIYDCDGHSDFEESIKLARTYGFRVAFSNMCIEFWFALHFHDLCGDPIPMKFGSHSQAQIDLINKGIELYNKKAAVKVKEYEEGSKVVHEDFFELMMAIDPHTHHPRVENAYYRAKTIHTKKRLQGAEFSESVTAVYELINELGVVVEKNKEKKPTKAKGKSASRT